MSEPTTATEALQQAEAKLVELQSMSPSVSISFSPAKAKCRLSIMELTGMVLNGFLPAEPSEAARASRLYAIAEATQ